MNRFARFIPLIGAVLLVAGGCGRGHTPDVADAHDDHSDHAQSSRGEPDAQAPDAGEDDAVIRIDSETLAEFGIRLQEARSGILRQGTSLSGEVVLNPDRVAHVVARAGGIGIEILHTIGDRIDAGETLAVLESPGLADAKANFLSRAAQAALAEMDLERAEVIHTNTIQLLEIVAEHPGLDRLRGEIAGLDIGSNRGTLITTYADFKAAGAIYDREKTLYERQISSESEYLQAESEFKKSIASFQAVRDDLAFSNRRELDEARRSKVVADVALQATELRLLALGLNEEGVAGIDSESDRELSHYEIKAPIAGRIIERHLVRGESVESGEQIFVVADLSSVWVQLTVYQRDLGFVTEGQSVHVAGTHELGHADAVIEYVSPILDETTRTTTARLVLDNKDGHWRPGMFVQAELGGADVKATVIVPRSALQELDGETIIFVETEEGLVPRTIAVGRRDAESVEITAGLQVGDRYVASGGLALKAELNKAALEHAGHGH
jgi:cobalt-zinc-cadmium efflux system membrane fusion protein